jgi:hypothetical protein
VPVASVAAPSTVVPSSIVSANAGTGRFSLATSGDASASATDIDTTHRTPVSRTCIAIAPRNARGRTPPPSS